MSKVASLTSKNKGLILPESNPQKTDTSLMAEGLLPKFLFTQKDDVYDFSQWKAPVNQGSSFGNNSLGGNDHITLTNFNDVFRGGEGNDTLLGGGGLDLIYGDNGNDKIYGGAGNDILFGSIDNKDYLGQNIDKDGGNDYIEGNEGNDKIDGGSGNDVILGGEGNDRIEGCAGNDTIYGGEGNDVINGGAWKSWVQDSPTSVDIIFAGGGDDLVDGYEGTDEIHGGDGNDSLGGGEGNDLIYGDAGRDSLAGSWYTDKTDTDKFFYTSVSDSAVGNGDLIYDFNVNFDKLVLSSNLHVGNFKLYLNPAHAFTGGGNSSARFNDANDLLEIDNNGDGAADMNITLQGVTVGVSFPNIFILE